jgi:ribose/xylose/arabinose/galactoside ABC-type transport system permease subunit
MLSKNMARQFGKIFNTLLGLILILGLFMVLSRTFRQWGVLWSICEDGTYLAVMAVGTTVVLISGGLDLSVGSLLALCSCVVGALLVEGWPIWAAVGVCLGVGLFIGFINGMTVVLTRVPPFIVTLGMLMIARGLAMMLGEDKSMTGFSPAFKALGSGKVVPIAIAFGVVLIVALVLWKTRFGFNIFAIGGNEEVARLSGVSVSRYKVMAYCVGGLLAGLAAVMHTARFDLAKSDVGQGYELQAIAAAVIGGTSLFGGVGGAGRTLIGVLIITTLNTGLIHCKVGPYWQNVAIGSVIIIAVFIDRLQRRQKV